MVKYRSKLGRGNGKESGNLNKKDCQWLNFWLLISIVLFFVGFVIEGANTVPTTFIAIFGLLGLLSLWTIPILLVIVVFKGNIESGLPDLSTFIANKIKKK
tara:strand:- start:416 stop:718 length:303 start_codon:yes stop_codon:yes gene_type:complete